MSNQAGLVNSVARSLFISEATLSVQMRFLREADLVPTGGRGRGSYAMTPQDAATLLVAAAVTSVVKDTAALTDSFLQLPMDRHEVRGPGQHLPHGSRYPETMMTDPWPGLSQQRVLRKFGFGRVDDKVTLLTALTAVFEMFIRNEMFPELTEADFETGAALPNRLTYQRSLMVEFYLPIPCAQITYRAERILKEYLMFGPTQGGQLDMDWYKLVVERRGMQGCLMQQRSVDEIALEKVAASVGKEGLRAAMDPRPSKRKKTATEEEV
jgi:hypothetical protein